MAWTPISLTVPQYMDGNGDPYSGAVLKFYAAGTTTNISLATDSTGGTTASSVALNASGFPEISGNVVIPHLEEDYKVALYPTQAAADADSGAVWTIDNVSIGQDVAQWVDSGSTPTQASSTSFTVSGDQTSLFHVGRRLRLTDSGGTDYATVTAVSYSSPNTTVTVAVDGGGSLDAGLSTVQVSLLTADSTSALPGVEVSEDDWTHQGNVTVEGSLAAPTVSGNVAIAGTLTAGTAPLPRSWLAGLALSNDTDTAHDIAIAVGAARDDSDAADLRLAATLTKQIDAAWSVGDDAGGLDTGAVANNTWYAVWLIRRSDTGVVDALFSASASSPMMPASYDQKRRIGWVRTDGSANIIQFLQSGDRVLWLDPGSIGLDESDFALSTSEQTITLDYCPPSVDGIMNAGVTGTEAAYAWLYETGVTSAAVGETASLLPNVGSRNTSSGQTNTHVAEVRVGVDASRQIHARGISTHTLDLQVIGWIDRRGRDD